VQTSKLASVFSGEWALTAWGVRTTGAESSCRQQYWFCPDTACTAPVIVMKELRQYKWSIAQACTWGTVVKVLDIMDDDTMLRFSPMNLLLVMEPQK